MLLLLLEGLINQTLIWAGVPEAGAVLDSSAARWGWRDAYGGWILARASAHLKKQAMSKQRETHTLVYSLFHALLQVWPKSRFRGGAILPSSS